jgi:predicted Rossmann-fold nucleotide-binding protein
LPGGFGTLDEIFEMATLVQTGKIRDFPLVLIGSVFWRPLLDFIQTLVTAGTIDGADAARLHLTDSVDQAVEVVTATALEQFGLTYGPRLRPRWLLGELFR